MNFCFSTSSWLNDHTLFILTIGRRWGGGYEHAYCPRRFSSFSCCNRLENLFKTETIYIYIYIFRDHFVYSH